MKKIMCAVIIALVIMSLFLSACTSAIFPHVVSRPSNTVTTELAKRKQLSADAQQSSGKEPNAQAGGIGAIAEDEHTPLLTQKQGRYILVGSSSVIGAIVYVIYRLHRGDHV